MSTAKSLPFFTITPLLETADDVKCVMEMRIDIGYTFFLTDPDKNGFICCYLPAFDIHFYATSEEEADKICGISAKSFVNHYIDREGFTTWARKIKSLGFEPGGGILDWRKIFSKKKITKKIHFKLLHVKSATPDIYEGAKENIGKETLQLAC